MQTKILYILTKPDLGGVSKYLLELINCFPENFEPYFIMSCPGYFSEELEKLGYKKNIFFVPMTNSIINLPLHIKSNIETFNIIRKIKPDLIHCNSTTGGIVGRICGTLTFKPVIFTAHGWAFTDGISKSKQIFYKCLETLLAFFTKKVICVSDYDNKLAQNIMPKNKLITIHNGIADVEVIYKKENFSDDKLRMIMISRFCPQKDPYTLINAVGELGNSNIELDLYGYGEELSAVLDTIQKYSGQNIQYKGEIFNVTSVLKNYDVYCLISNWEGLPIGIIEALRAGMPVIVSDVGGCSEEVVDGENGFVIPRKDKEKLKEKIKFLYVNKPLLAEFSKKSCRLYESEFTADKMCQKTFKLYEEILNK